MSSSGSTSEQDSSTQYGRAIDLPSVEIFKNLRNAKRFSIDIGEYLILVVNDSV